MGNEAAQRPRPPRGELFSDEGAKLVHAAIKELDERAKDLVYRWLRQHLLVPERPGSVQAERVARAVAAVHEITEILEERGLKPIVSVEIYRTMREEYPERRADLHLGALRRLEQDPGAGNAMTPQPTRPEPTPDRTPLAAEATLQPVMVVMLDHLSPTGRDELLRVMHLDSSRPRQLLSGARTSSTASPGSCARTANCRPSRHGPG